MKTKSLPLAIVFMFCIAIQNQCAAVIFNDGDVHTIDYVTAASVDVYDGPGLPLPDVTTVNLVEGGCISGSLELYENSHAYIRGGIIEEDTELYDNSHIHVSGGQLTEDLELLNNSLAIITGGRLLDFIETFDNSRIIIFGGFIGMALMPVDSGRITLYGTDFTIDGVPVDYGEIPVSDGILGGTLAGGDTINDIFFSIAPHASIILAPKPATIIYVDANATDLNTGSSWADAYNYLQDALTVASYHPDVNEIRVAQGTYKPDQGAGMIPGDRMATFQLINGLTLKGGYVGYGHHDPDVRDIKLYETILSGDLAGNDVDFVNPVDLYDDPTWSENSYHVVTGSGTSPTTVLEGFTITAGNANAVYQYDTNAVGGGMYNNQGKATVANCTFIHNLTLWKGGAMYNEGSNLTLTNCTFTENATISFDGAGMFNYESSPILTNCTFKNNITCRDQCAGMYNRRHCRATLTNCTFIGNKGDAMSNYFDSNATLTDCTFSGNTGCGMANWQSSPTLTGCRFDGNGQGGMANRSGSIPILTNCIITRNSSTRGAGMYNNNSSPILTNCIFSGNRAGDWAGGMYNRYLSSPILTNCAFIGNRAWRWGGGMYNNGLAGECNPILTNCTFADNLAGRYGGGILNQACRPTVTNCIVWSNLPEQIFDQYTSASSVTFSDVQDGWAGEGNIDADPCFVSPGYWVDISEPNIIVEPDDPNAFWIDGDYHLLVGSPCINAGDPNYVAEPNETDLDGRPRVIGGRIDMGAYEFNHIPIADAGPDRDAYAWIDGMAEVTLDGTNSYDDDGHPLTYNWSWTVDGNTHTATDPNLTIELPVGEHIIELIVNDGIDDSEPNEVVMTVIEPMEAHLWIFPRVINRYSRMSAIFALLRLPEGVTKDQVDSDQPLLLYPGGIEAIRQYVIQYRRRRAQQTSILAFFDKGELMNAIPDEGSVELQVVGRLKTGRYFYGSDIVRIVRRRRIPRRSIRGRNSSSVTLGR